jgi:hypothetical protein
VSTWSRSSPRVEGRAIVLEGGRLKALDPLPDKFPDVRRLLTAPGRQRKIIADRLQRAPFWR